jgi:galactokinase
LINPKKFMSKTFTDIFGTSNEKIYSAFAHGRLDVMGGIADYSGSLVLQKPIAEKTTINIRKRDDNLLLLTSIGEKKLSFKISIDDLIAIPNGNYPMVHNLFTHHKWASYVVGCLILLNWDKKIKFNGFEILIESNIPIGKGLSSSAALEIATLKVFTEYFNIHFTGTELPTLAQKVENYIVKAPCGLMDQLTSYFGKANHLLPITCQPDILHDSLPIPENIHFIGIDSGTKHSVSGNSYTKVRTATFMGYSILANLQGIDTQNIKSIPRSELPQQGYLANMNVQYYKFHFSKNLPLHMKGKDFLEKYGQIIDDVTSINPEENYPILAATKHAIFENKRINRFQHILTNLNGSVLKTASYRVMGNLMTDSHDSYSACGLGAERTDELVKMAKLKVLEGIHGARITGGGSGGTVCLICTGEKGIEAARQIWTEYQERNKIEVKLFE